MRTSKLMTLSVLVAAGIGLTACSGSTGPQGTPGSTGPTGAPGADGATAPPAPLAPPAPPAPPALPAPPAHGPRRPDGRQRRDLHLLPQPEQRDCPAQRCDRFNGVIVNQNDYHNAAAVGRPLQGLDLDHERVWNDDTVNAAVYPDRDLHVRDSQLPAMPTSPAAASPLTAAKPTSPTAKKVSRTPPATTSSSAVLLSSADPSSANCPAPTHWHESLHLHLRQPQDLEDRCGMPSRRPRRHRARHPARQRLHRAESRGRRRHHLRRERHEDLHRRHHARRPTTREVVTTAACNACHGRLAAPRPPRRRPVLHRPATRPRSQREPELKVVPATATSPRWSTACTPPGRWGSTTPSPASSAQRSPTRRTSATARPATRAQQAIFGLTMPGVAACIGLPRERQVLPERRGQQPSHQTFAVTADSLCVICHTQAEPRGATTLIPARCRG